MGLVYRQVTSRLRRWLITAEQTRRVPVPATGRASVSGSRWPARYEIRVDGVLDDQWADWFGGLQLSNDGTETIIVGLLPHQSALHDVLAKVRDLGLCLTLVCRLDADDAGDRPQI